MPAPFQVNNICKLAAANGGSTYQWYQGVNKIQGANTKYYTVTVADYYHVEMTNASGCFGQSDDQFVSACGVATNDLSNLLEMKVYPNPADITLTFDIVSNEAIDELSIQLFSIDGKLFLEPVQKKYVSDKLLKVVDVSSFPNGMYLYRILTNNRTSEGSVIIQH